MEKFEITSLKSFSKETRIKLAAEFRKDPDLFNVVNGVGGLSEKSRIGLVNGTLTKDSVPLKGVEVEITEKNKTSQKAKTNQYGYYKIDLAEGTYTINVLFGSEKITDEVQISNGKITVFDHDFKEPEGEGKSEKTRTSTTVNPETEVTGDETGEE